MFFFSTWPGDAPGARRADRCPESFPIVHVLWRLCIMVYNYVNTGDLDDNLVSPIPIALLVHRLLSL